MKIEDSERSSKNLFLFVGSPFIKIFRGWDEKQRGTATSFTRTLTGIPRRILFDGQSFTGHTRACS
jgi:hypothetical protein